MATRSKPIRLTVTIRSNWHEFHDGEVKMAVDCNPEGTWLRSFFFVAKATKVQFNYMHPGASLLVESRDGGDSYKVLEVLGQLSPLN